MRDGPPPAASDASFALRALVLVVVATVSCGGRSTLLEDVAPIGAPTPAEAGTMGGGDTVVASPEAGPPEPPPGGFPPDGGEITREDASREIDASGISEVSECLHAPNEIYVLATGGYAGLKGASEVTGPRGAWLALGGGASFAQVNSPDGAWAFVAAAGVVSGPYALAPGTTFHSGPGVTAGGAYAQVKVDGVGCGDIPTGTFTIVDFAVSEGDQAPPARLLAWFDLTCGDAGQVVGCVRYTE